MPSPLILDLSEVAQRLRKPVAIFDLPSPRQEVGSVEGTLQEVGTHRNVPAAKITEARTRSDLWCRLSEDLQAKFQEKAPYEAVWKHQRVIVRGTLRYSAEGALLYVIAHDIQRLESKSVPLDAIRDRDFTGELSVSEYIDRLRDGTGRHQLGDRNAPVRAQHGLRRERG